MLLYAKGNAQNMVVAITSAGVVILVVARYQSSIRKDKVPKGVMYNFPPLGIDNSEMQHATQK